MKADPYRMAGGVGPWHLNTKRLESLDTGLKDLTFLKWSRTGPQLAPTRTPDGGPKGGGLRMAVHEFRFNLPVLQAFFGGGDIPCGWKKI